MEEGIDGEGVLDMLEYGVERNVENRFIALKGYLDVDFEM